MIAGHKRHIDATSQTHMSYRKQSANVLSLIACPRLLNQDILILCCVCLKNSPWLNLLSLLKHGIKKLILKVRALVQQCKIVVHEAMAVGIPAQN